jgi:hypothetical protein
MTTPWNKLFKVGDVIVSKHGSKPSVVENVPSGDYGNYVLRYLHNGRNNYVDRYNASNYSLVDSEPETMTQTLYSFIKADGTTSYGTHIGTNSKNQLLIEEKGTGTIHTFDKKDLEEVLPYTFSAKFNNSETHFVGTPDTLKVGDYLLSSSGVQLYVVTALDTKEKNAKKFKGVKLVTQEI